MAAYVEYDFNKMEVNPKAMEAFLDGTFGSLWSAFYWVETPQGEDFWGDVAESEVIDPKVLANLEEQYWTWVHFGDDEDDEDDLWFLDAEELNDPVDNPAHYGDGEIECIDYMEDNMSVEGFMGYLEGNTKKYLHRFRYKGKPVEDLKKAQWYLGRLIDKMEGN